MANNQPKSLFTQIDETIDLHIAKQKAKKIKEQRQNQNNNSSLF